jgi:hypothetical protein
MNEIAPRSRAVTALQITLAFLASCTLVYIGAVAADKYHLPFFHDGWAMAHGAIFLVFPLYFALSFVLLNPLLRPLHARAHAREVPAQRVSGFAVASLVFSGAGFMIPLVGSIPAIVLGHVARHRCKTKPELSGAGIAMAGLVISYLGLAYSAYSSASFRGSRPHMAANNGLHPDGPRFARPADKRGRYVI